MTYDDVLAEVVKQGAIRICKLSKGYHIAYRVKHGELEARGLLKIQVADEGSGQTEAWEPTDQMSGAQQVKSPDGWFWVNATHPQIEPIELEAAKRNPGYYAGLMRRCETCKKYKLESEFERDMSGEGGRRTWECNQCASERAAEVKANKADRHGDRLKRETHASEPPVEGEI